MKTPKPDATAEETAIVETVETGEQASLEICNLVSQGHSLKEAREIAAGGDGKAGETLLQVDRVNLLGLPVDAPDSREGLFSALANVGKVQHPNSSTEKLVSVYRTEILKEAGAE